MDENKMRYLKTYKLFEANWYDIKDHLNVLTDMSLPLCDKDFNVQVSDQSITKYIRGKLTFSGKCILVNIVKNKFTFSEIKEELLDMVHYMDSEGWEILDIKYDHDMETIVLTGKDGSHNCKLEEGELITVDGNRKVNGWIQKLGVKFVEKGEVKTNESTEEDVHKEMMIKKYGVEEIEECDEVIRNISDMLLELEDLGLSTLVGYSPMTIVSIDPNPKISIEIKGPVELFDSNSELIHNIGDQIKDYVKDYKFVTGSGEWVDTNTWNPSSNKKVYAILLQK